MKFRLIYVTIGAIAFSGCTTSYHHLSNPSISDDGYDLLCAGLEIGNQLRVAGRYCHNVSPAKGEYIMLDMVWKWGQS